MSGLCVILVGIAIGFYCRYWKKKEQKEAGANSNSYSDKDKGELKELI